MKKAMISMKKAKRGVVSFAVIFAMLLSICSFTAMADSTDPTCYADVDEIVLTYPDTAPTDITPVLKKDGVVVETDSTVNGNTVVIKPATGEFARDVLYELTAGTFSQYFKIKTLINGINEEDLSAYNGPKGGTGSAVVLIDSDNDGAEELFCVNHSSLYFKNNDAAKINSTENYTVKYDLSAYAYTTNKTNYTFLAKNYYNLIGHMMFFNATAATTSTAPDGFHFYRSNYQPIKYLNDNTWQYDATKYPNTTRDNAGLSGLSDVNAGNGEEMGTPVKHGIVFYDRGTSPIEVLKPAGVSVGVKLKKIGAAGTLYIGGNEKITRSNGTAKSGYFLFGGGEWGNNFISMENFVATTYEEVVEDVSLSNATATKDANSVTLRYDINKGGANASYPVWIVAAAYDSSHRLLGTATSSAITLMETLTNQSVTISNVDTSKIEEIKIFTWDTSSSIKPYGAPTLVSIPTN